MQRQVNLSVLTALFPGVDVFRSEKLLDEYDDDIESVVDVIYNELNATKEKAHTTVKEEEEEKKLPPPPPPPQIATVTAAPESKQGVQIKGECTGPKVITATWEYVGGYSPGENDIIGLYVYNRELNKSFYSTAKVAKCLPASTHSFTVWYDGFYELRYFAGASAEPVCRSERIIVGDEVTLRATVGEDTVHVQWDNKTSAQGDWIGLYGTAERSNKKYTQYQYVEPVHLETPLAGMDFRLPYEAGTYEFRYFRRASTSMLSGYFCSGYSNLFKVRHTGAEFSYFQNGKILVVFFMFPAERPTAKDRIEISDRGTAIGKAFCGKYDERLSKKNAGIVPIDLQQKSYALHKTTCKEWKMTFVTGEGKVLATTVLSKLVM